ncbi:zinc finger protein 226 isoform X1 [Drosophila sechellia]|uniref:GM26294 n=1 Tax=Drosophila sechellia TaxID=7238 RepID=B4HKY4_DROSE|nr:zinc finger protein 226 isoform X1 [Drosophila sechellia]EDW42948.1 GM26294 [Drosophila sechellia]
MEFSADLNGFNEDSIEPCRTCGIYFTMGMDMDQAIVKPIFGSDDAAVADMAEILEQMNDWNIKVAKEDGRPQYMCIACIAEFHRLIKFKRSCVETQEQFSELEYHREHNGIVIKREIEPEEEKFCGFIYLDTDEEDNSDEDGSRRVCAAFDIPHVPIKEEHMARVPVQNNDKFDPPEPKDFASPVDSGFAMIGNDALTSGMLGPSIADRSGTADDGSEEEEEEEEEEIVRFTYDDDNDAIAPLPPPIYSPVVCCKLCFYESPDQDAHMEHMRRTHLLKDWECHICGKKFTNAQESRIKFHIKYHKLQRHIKCPVCGFICNSKETLKEHKQAVHVRTKCTYCGKTVKNASLQAHLKKHLEEGEAELAQQLKKLEQLPVNLQSQQLSSLQSSVTKVTTAFEGSNIPGESTVPEDSNVTEDSSVPSIETSNHTDIQCPMGPPADGEVPVTAASPSSEPTESVIECSYCSDTFEKAQQLQAHVLATHTQTRKRRRSSDNKSLVRKTTQEMPTSPIAKITKKPTIESEESVVQEDSSAHLDSPAQQESRTAATSNDSPPVEQVPEKAYISCYICGRSFDLKIKLNRHLKQHKG